MLSAIVQKLTGMTVLEYLKPRLFDPLGIEGETWETCPRGINTGGWGLSVKTEDIARFGQLYLQKGRWNGQTLVPEKWIEEATTKQVSNGDPAAASDWSQGYGYQFWRCRHGVFRGDGAFGQYCVVMPSYDAVLAITSGVGDMQAVLNVVWDHLLPAMQQTPLPKSETDGELKRKLAHLSLRPPDGEPTSPTAKRISGKTYRFEANDQKIQAMTLTFEGKRCLLALQKESGEQRISCGQSDWVKGVAARGNTPSGKVAVRGAWKDPDTYTLKLCYYETPFIDTIACKFSGDQVTVNIKANVGFGPTEHPPLIGHTG
jgi:hypothetical protein